MNRAHQATAFINGTPADLRALFTRAMTLRSGICVGLRAAQGQMPMARA